MNQHGEIWWYGAWDCSFVWNSLHNACNRTGAFGHIQTSHDESSPSCIYIYFHISGMESLSHEPHIANCSLQSYVPQHSHHPQFHSMYVLHSDDNLCFSKSLKQHREEIYIHFLQNINKKAAFLTFIFWKGVADRKL